MNIRNLLLVVAAATTGFSTLPVYADAINPQIKDRGNTYSKEKADTTFYGTGPAGRANEAMMLRFDVERMLQDGDYDAAIPKAKKACQLDPGEPECHLLLARALTRKFYNKEGAIDEKLLRDCLGEWLMLWHHDADQSEQVEAKLEAKRMIRITKVLEKKKRAEYEAKLEARNAVAKQRQQEEEQALQDARVAGARTHEQISRSRNSDME